jgi:hypothetical protein
MPLQPVRAITTPQLTRVIGGIANGVKQFVENKSEFIQQKQHLIFTVLFYRIFLSTLSAPVPSISSPLHIFKPSNVKVTCSGPLLAA